MRRESPDISIVAGPGRPSTLHVVSLGRVPSRPCPVWVIIVCNRDLCRRKHVIAASPTIEVEERP
jgi:hypothetical protein